MDDKQHEEMIRAEVTAITLRDSKLMTAEKLGSLLEYEWERADLNRGSGTGPVAAVLAITAQSVREVSRHPESPDVAAGIVCDSTLRWAAAHRLASGQYARVVGLIAAAVIRALLGDMQEDGHLPAASMDDKQHQEMIRLYDIGQPKAIRVTFTVTIEMTDQQRDGYAAEHGAGFVALEVKGRFPGEASEALKSIPWVREYARVKITDPKIEKG